MNDRLKFRVWDKEEKTYAVLPYGSFALSESGELFWVESNCDCSELNTEDYIVEQCTGLKDKNGKLIFEGDVIQTPSQRFLLKVDDFNVLACVYPDFSDGFDWAEFVREIWYQGRQGFIEVIGNIHENPELLK